MKEFFSKLKNMFDPKAEKAEPYVRGKGVAKEMPMPKPEKAMPMMDEDDMMGDYIRRVYKRDSRLKKGFKL